MFIHLYMRINDQTNEPVTSASTDSFRMLRCTQQTDCFVVCLGAKVFMVAFDCVRESFSGIHRDILPVDWERKKVKISWLIIIIITKTIESVTNSHFEMFKDARAQWSLLQSFKITSFLFMHFSHLSTRFALLRNEFLATCLADERKGLRSWCKAYTFEFYEEKWERNDAFGRKMFFELLLPEIVRI